MGRTGFIALIVAGGPGYLTYTEGTLAFQSSEKPVEITLKELIAQGPDGDAHVVVTDFFLCENLAHQFQDKKPSVWTHVWIPAVPIDEVENKVGFNPTNVKALFFSTSIRNLTELEAKLNKPKVQGLVTNRISSLETKIRNLLRESYPGTDFDKCLIIQEGRTPFSRGAIYALGGGAALALLLAIGLFVAALSKRSANAHS